MDPYDNDSFMGNLGYRLDHVYADGTLVRADESWIYLKVNRDYDGAADHTIWKINPLNGERVWSSGKASGEDTGAPRAYQLYNSPDGTKTLHIAAFYGSNWDTLNLDDYSTNNYFHDSHSCLGSRVLMGNWGWRNNRMRSPHSISYYHGGQLRWWNGIEYEIKINQDIAIIDHAWDGTRCVLFALSGFHGGEPYDKGRYIILDNEGNISQDVEMSDIYLPNGSYNWRPTNTDIVMKLSVKGDYIYAVERTTSTEINFVRRCISTGFSLESSVSLGASYTARATSYCVNDTAVYIQYSDKIEAYSLDLNTLLWQADTPYRSLYHTDIQGFDYYRWPGRRNYPNQTIACNNQYVYNTTDDRLQVRRDCDGEVLYEHVLSNIPYERTHKDEYAVVGKAGDIILMPDCILVVSFLDSSRLWAFRPDTVSGLPPQVVDLDQDERIAYVGRDFNYQLKLKGAEGPFSWSIDFDGTDDEIDNLISVDSFGLVSWAPDSSNANKSYEVKVNVFNSHGVTSKSFTVKVQNAPFVQLLRDLDNGDNMEVEGLDTKFGYSYKTGQYHGVKGTGRYFYEGEIIKFTFSNTTSEGKGIYPQLSFNYESNYNKYSSAIKIKFYPIGYVYVPANSVRTKLFFIRNVDEGYHNLINIYHSGLGLDKIELEGAYLSEENIPPVALPGGPYLCVFGNPVLFDGSGSFDPDGSTLRAYEWSFGDSSSASGESPEHLYENDGSYTVSLRVQDADNDWSEWIDTQAIILIGGSDEDNDGLTNQQELDYETDPFDMDMDNDGLNDYSEVIVYHTDPDYYDSDDDGMPDKWEIDFNLNPLADEGSNDYDNDNLTNIEEYWYGGEGTVNGGSGREGDEFVRFPLDPYNPDSDNDGLLDGEEVKVYYTDAGNPDTDFDLMPDKWEVDNNLDYHWDDSREDVDLDLSVNYFEYVCATDPNDEEDYFKWSLNRNVAPDCDVIIEVYTKTERFYVIEYVGEINKLPLSWNPLIDVSQGSGETMVVTDSSVEQRYYRIKVSTSDNIE